MALRQTEILKHDWIGPQKQPVALVTTYRTRKLGSGLAYTFRSVVMSGTHDCLIIDWKDEATALKGHEQTLARVKRGEPIKMMAH